MKRLTKRAVEGTTPPQRRPEETDAAHRKRWSWLGDGEVRGFGVKIYGNGRRVFALRYRTRTGRQRMLTLGAFGELTVQEARDKARAEKVRVLDGDDPQAEKQREAVQIDTVDQLLTRWLEDYAKSHRRRWEEDKGRIERHLRSKLGKFRVEELTRDTLATWHRKLGEDAPVEANRCLETLRAAWRWAEGEGLLAPRVTDPTKSVKRFKERSRDRWLRKAEVKRLMEAASEEEDPHVRAAIPLFLLTGLRKRELLTAKWSNVDLQRGEILLPETKTGERQVRLLPEPAVQILRELPRIAESPFVFPRPSQPSEPRDDIKKPWSRIREAAGLQDVTLHDLRRTAGSHMAQAGVPLQVIGEVLGHSHPSVTKLYARIASENEREALDTLSAELQDVLLGIGKPSKNGAAAANGGSSHTRDRLRSILESDQGDRGLASQLRRLAAELDAGG